MDTPMTRVLNFCSSLLYHRECVTLSLGGRRMAFGWTRGTGVWVEVPNPHRCHERKVVGSSPSTTTDKGVDGKQIRQPVEPQRCRGQTPVRPHLGHRHYGTPTTTCLTESGPHVYWDTVEPGSPSPVPLDPGPPPHLH